jgi:hypothetical protein
MGVEYARPSPPIWDGLQQDFGYWLQNTMQGTQNTGVPGYQGPLSPDLNQTINPSVYGAWNPQGGQGGQFLTQMLQGGGFQQPSWLSGGGQQIANNGGMGAWGQQLQGQAEGNGPASGYLNNFLSMNPGGAASTLSNFAQNPVGMDVLPAWQAGLQAQQGNIERNLAQLKENYNSMGAFESNNYNNATSQYMTETTANQNALLSQMMLQSGGDALNRQYGAAGTMYGGALQGAGQLSNLSSGATALLSQMGYGMTGQMMQNNLTANGQNIGGANALMGGQADYLRVGGALGQQQALQGQNEINNMYQEWMRTQPAYNPLLPYYYGAATAFPQMSQGVSTPGFWGSLGSVLGGAGSLLGAAGGFSGIASLFK